MVAEIKYIAEKFERNKYYLKKTRSIINHIIYKTLNNKIQ